MVVSCQEFPARAKRLLNTRTAKIRIVAAKESGIAVFDLRRYDSGWNETLAGMREERAHSCCRYRHSDSGHTTI